MPLRRTFLAASLASLLPAAPAIGRAQAAPIDATIRRQAMAALDIGVPSPGPGAAILIDRGGETIVELAKGRSSLELDAPLRIDTVFPIASVTKMFTAATIVRLADERRLNLDAALSNYLSGLSFGDQVTLRHLLTHTGGISDRALNPVPFYGRQEVDTARQLVEIGPRPLNFTPGERQAYSNSGYVLLGAVIEAVTRQSWHGAMAEMFFRPLGLADTCFGAAATVIPRRAAGYTGDETASVRNANYISMTVPAAAGGLVSTPQDLRLWMRALVEGRALGSDGFNRMQTPAATITPSTMPYGFGLYVWSVRGQALVGHSGQIDGFASVLAYLPSHDVTVVALGNDDRFDAQTMGRRLAAIALGDPYPVPTSVAVSAQEMQALTGAYQAGDAPVRTLSHRDGKLYAQRGQGNVLPLQMTAEGRLHFVPDALTYFVPIKDRSGHVIGLDQFQSGEGPAVRLNRLADPVVR